MDLWAAGVILYYMCSQKYPFESEDQIANQPHQQISNASEAMRSLLDQIFTKDTEERPDIYTVLDIEPFV